MAETETEARTLRDLLDAAAEAYGGAEDRAAKDMAGLLAGAAAAARLQPLGARPERPPMLDHLAPALRAMASGRLADRIGRSAPGLPWTQGETEMPAGFAGRSAYVDILGPEGLMRVPGLRFGLYLQAPDSRYPPHSHAAEEFYYVLSGTARWQKADRAFQAMPPGSVIRHASYERHAMRTGAAPLLAMWVWTGNLDPSTYRIDRA